MPNCGRCSSADRASRASVEFRKSPQLWIRSMRTGFSSTPVLESRHQSCFKQRGDVRMNDLKKLIREVPDYPKPGILFYDLTTLLKDKQGFHVLIDRLCEHYNAPPTHLVSCFSPPPFIFPPPLPSRPA